MINRQHEPKELGMVLLIHAEIIYGAYVMLES